jgi:hypothetical protein
LPKLDDPSIVSTPSVSPSNPFEPTVAPLVATRQGGSPNIGLHPSAFTSFRSSLSTSLLCPTFSRFCYSVAKQHPEHAQPKQDKIGNAYLQSVLERYGLKEKWQAFISEANRP